MLLAVICFCLLLPEVVCMNLMFFPVENFLRLSFMLLMSIVVVGRCWCLFAVLFCLLLFAVVCW